MDNIMIEAMQPEEAKNVQVLVKKVFDLFIGPDYAQEGVDTFYNFIAHEHIIDRLCNQMHKAWVAKDSENQKIVGIIETRDNSHICLLFVDPSYHRRGIAKRLFYEAFKDSKEEITVNASPFAVTIYEKLGFKKISGELIKDGITYIPMIIEK